MALPKGCTLCRLQDISFITTKEGKTKICVSQSARKDLYHSIISTDTTLPWRHSWRCCKSLLSEVESRLLVSCGGLKSSTRHVSCSLIIFSPDENSSVRLDVVIHDVLVKLCLLLKFHPSSHVAYRVIPF